MRGFSIARTGVDRIHPFTLNGFGKQVSGGPGFNGESTKIDLAAASKNRLHAVVERKIEEVVKKDLAKRVQATQKTKKAKKKSLDIMIVAHKRGKLDDGSASYNSGGNRCVSLHQCSACCPASGGH